MIYYRVALCGEQSKTWRWKSTVLTSLETLFGFLRLYSMVPGDRMRVFFSTSIECLDDMLVRENDGVASNSVTAEQFLKERRCMSSQEVARLEAEAGTPETRVPVSTSVITEGPLQEWSMNPLEVRRLELELGSIGDHDTHYTFTLPTSMLQVIAWTKLLVRVQGGELEL